jgi:hypothetical protein
VLLVVCQCSRHHLRKFFSFPNPALLPYSYYIFLLVSHLIFDLSAPRFVLCVPCFCFECEPLFLGEDTMTVMEEDLRLCSVKPVLEGDRRFCFEVLSPTK